MQLWEWLDILQASVSGLEPEVHKAGSEER